MKSQNSRFVFAALLAAVMLLGAGQAMAVKIGFMAPLTGFAAADGKSSLIAAEMAVAQINAQGGLAGEQVELVVYDDQAKAEQAVPIANKLVGQDKVQFAISGSYSGPSRAVATVFQNAKIPYIAAYAVHPDITRAGDYCFRVVHLGPPQGKAGAMFVGDKLGLKKVSMIIMDNDYGVSTAEGFKEAAPEFGIDIVGDYTYSLKDRQFGSIVAKVKADNPDAIYITAYFFTAGPLVSQLRASGVTVPIIGSQAFDAQQFLEIAGPTAEGVYNVGGLDRDNDNPEFQEFLEAFQAEAGYSAENVAATVYSSFIVLADAVERAGTLDQAAVRDAIAATEGLPIYTGELASFNALGEINMPMNVNVVKDGTFVHYEWITDLELLAPPAE